MLIQDLPDNQKNSELKNMHIMLQHNDDNVQKFLNRRLVSGVGQLELLDIRGVHCCFALDQGLNNKAQATKQTTQQEASNTHRFAPFRPTENVRVRSCDVNVEWSVTPHLTASGSSHLTNLQCVHVHIEKSRNWGWGDTNVWT
jgi:hypothetical protein